jgi:hypothetical protein
MQLYTALSLSKPDYASVVWNNLTLIDSYKHEYIKMKSANLCYGRFYNSDFLAIIIQYWQLD